MDWASDYDGGSSYLDLPAWEDDYSSPMFSEDIWSGGGNSYVDSYDPWAGLGSNSWIAPYVSPEVFYEQPSYQAPAQTYSQGAIGAPGAATPLAQQPQGQSWLDALLKPQTLLGLGGGLASLIGTLSAGGQVQSQGPRPTTAQKAAIEQGGLLASLGAGGQMPLQQHQASLLQAIMSGQGLAQPYAAAVERAFDPALGDLYTRAAQQGRRRGFHDAPATSPPGGAILGPGLADIQGQQAQAKLALMTQLPQLFNQPIATQGSFAQNYLKSAQDPYMMERTTSQPLGAQVGRQVGGILSGVGGGIQQAENQQNNPYQSLIDALQGRRPDSMSGV